MNKIDRLNVDFNLKRHYKICKLWNAVSVRCGAGSSPALRSKAFFINININNLIKRTVYLVKYTVLKAGITNNNILRDDIK